ncbi:MAG: ubiquinol-cytochrome c reductase iron-sulfur subunit [Stellaceae bacterium]
MADLAQDKPESAGTVSGGHERPTRRDFLSIAGTAIAGIGLASALWPLIDSMNPAKDTLAAGAPIDVDLRRVQPGQQILVLWRSRPIFVVNRTPTLLKVLQSKADIALLSDPDSTVHQQPKYAQNWHRSIKPEYSILVGICTHLGCIPEYMPQPNSLMPGWIGGYFCPCHGSRYDLAGRVYNGVPAPYNLPIPPYHFVNKTTVRIGENPPNQSYQFSSIVQI